jgi:endonuclease/exonuclease/phosphatase family metal-dependent hydrolase
LKRVLSFLVVLMGCMASSARAQVNEESSGGSADRREAGRELTLMCFNIRYDNPADGQDRWDQRTPLVIDTIREHDPDVVGLQEALQHQLQDLLEALPEYAHVGVGRDDGKSGGEYSAILYRKSRLMPASSGTFWLSDTPEAPGSKSWGNRVIRICTWTHLRDQQSGQSFWIYNTHLDHDSQNAREEGVKLIARRIAERQPKEQAGSREPAFLMGDFNAGEENPATMYIKGRVQTGLDPAPIAMVDTFRALHPDEAEVGTFHRFRGTPGRDKIDYIFAEPDITVRSAEIIRKNDNGRYPSDHFPLIAKVVLP